MDIRQEVLASLPREPEAEDDPVILLLPAFSPQNWRMDMTQKQVRLLYELADLCSGFDWAEQHGLRHLQQTLKYGIANRVNEFVAIDAAKETSRQPKPGEKQEHRR